jgi:hypothetical protein
MLLRRLLMLLRLMLLMRLVMLRRRRVGRRRLMMLSRVMMLIRLRNWTAGLFDDGLVEPLPDRNSGPARGFTCGVADFRPHTFHVPRDALPHALTQNGRRGQTRKRADGTGTC